MYGGLGTGPQEVTHSIAGRVKTTVGGGRRGVWSTVATDEESQSDHDNHDAGKEEGGLGDSGEEGGRVGGD